VTASVLRYFFSFQLKRVKAFSSNTIKKESDLTTWIYYWSWGRGKETAEPSSTDIFLCISSQSMGSVSYRS